MSLVRYSLILYFTLLLGCGEQTDKTEQSQVSSKTKKSADSLNTGKDSEITSDLKPPALSFRLMAPNRISKYDKIIKKYSRRYGFDWRLIAAQIFAESHFKFDAKSRVGALGLMQIMPSTAKYLGTDPNSLLTPEQNISLGCLYDRRLFNRWSNKKVTKNRLAFTLASYNAGRSRVLRAESRAGSARTKNWEAVKPFLPGETRIYVDKIFNQYQLYKKKHF